MHRFEYPHRPARPVPLLHPLPHPTARLAIDLTDGVLYNLPVLPEHVPPQGGLFCDEPGLGKTITALALILKTLADLPTPPPLATPLQVRVSDTVSLPAYQEVLSGRFRAFADHDPTAFPTRQAMLLPYSETHARRSSGRHVRQPEYLESRRGLGSLPAVQSRTKTATIFLSQATLIVVPNVLTAHWVSQIDQHIDKGLLRVLVVNTPSELPEEPAELASSFDVVVASFEAISQLFNAARDDVPVLLRVHFLRVIVDEGHSLGGANVSVFSHACHRLRAERRWVMTGTPTPTTNRSDVDHLHSLLRFIREKGYGLDKKAWNVGIREPYARFQNESLTRLSDLLKHVMIRADKSVLSAKCHVRNVLLDFTQEQAKAYNWLVSLTRRNLITSDWFSEVHQQSFLNRKNLKLAQTNIRNLRYACNLSGTQNAVFTKEDIVHTLDELYEKHREKAAIELEDRFEDPVAQWPLLQLHSTDGNVIQTQRDIQVRVDLLEKLRDSGEPYLRLTRRLKRPMNGKASVSRVYSGALHDIGQSFLQRKSNCARCYAFTAIPMVTPCAHLLCEACVITDKNRCVARHCGSLYRLDDEGVPEDFIELQPSAYSRDGWKAEWDRYKSHKVSYLIERIKSLPKNEEWFCGESRPRETFPKVIIHSQFLDNLYAVMLLLKNCEELKDAYVEMAMNKQDISNQVKKQRHLTAGKYAQQSVKKFAEDPDIRILLMTTKQGSVGWDLSFVQYIFLLEPVWDASSELQIISRAHRIGAKRDIYVERLVMRNSIEHELMKDLENTIQNDLAPIDNDTTGDAKNKKDLSRVRRILRSLKPVSFVTDEDLSGSSEEIRQNGVAGVKRLASEVDPGTVGETSRRVRFRAD